MTYRSWVVGVFVYLLAHGARAETQDFAVTLDYLPGHYTAQCPNEAFFRGEIARRLGYDLFATEAPQHLTLVIGFQQNQYQLVGKLRDGNGKLILDEMFQGVTCEAAVMQEVNSIVAEFIRFPEPCLPCPVCPPVSTEPAKSPRPLEVPASVLRTLELAALPATERIRVQVESSAVFSFGVAPVTVGGVSLSLGILRKDFRIAVEMRGLFAPDVTIKHIPITAGYHYVVGSVASSGCYQLWWMVSCLRAEAGSLAIINPVLQVAPTPMFSFSFGGRVGIERVLTPWVALQAYGEFSYRPVAGVLKEELTKIVVWPGSLLSGSIGFGPVFSLPAR